MNSSPVVLQIGGWAVGQLPTLIKPYLVTETCMSNPTFLAGGDKIHSSSEDEITGAD